MMSRHILLVGLPGSGKSIVGRLVAEGLPAPLIDIDTLLIREMGMPVAQIFGMVGEVKFRQMERDAVETARAREPCVLVPGGGWAAQPGHIEAAQTDSFIVYLKCLAMTATRRSEKGEVRPLLVGVDPMERMRALLKAREPFYRLADCEVAVDTKPAQAVADELIRLARTRGGWH